MGQMMRCAVWYGQDDLRLEQRPVPRVGPGEVLVKVAFCGICGTDLHALGGKPMTKGFVPGHILGHEYSGVVTAIGAGVTTVSVGQQIVGAGGMPCGKCLPCRNGETHYCEQSVRIKEGAWAEYVSVPEGCVYPLPEGVSLELGAMAEPVANAINTIQSSPIDLQDTVLIVGAGTIGLLLVQLAKQRGAGMVIVSEPNTMKRTLAKELGASVTVDPVQEDLLDVVAQITGGVGVDVAIEAVGLPQTVQQCIAAARRGGTVMIHGWAEPHVEVPLRPHEMIAKLLTIQGIIGRCWDKALKMLGDLQVRLLITRHFPLEEIHQAVEFMRAGQGVKVLIAP